MTLNRYVWKFNYAWKNIIVAFKGKSPDLLSIDFNEHNAGPSGAHHKYRTMKSTIIID